MSAWDSNLWHWSKAVAHVVDLVGSRAYAINEIVRKICDGEIAATDRSTGESIKMAPKGWQIERDAYAILCSGNRGRNEPDLDRDNYFGGEGIFLSRTDVLKIWPADESKPAGLVPAEYPLKDARGADADYDWEKILLRAFKLVWIEGLPESQNKLVDKVHASFKGNPDWANGGPGRTQMIEHLRPLFQAIKGAVRE